MEVGFGGRGVEDCVKICGMKEEGKGKRRERVVVSLIVVVKLIVVARVPSP